MDLVIRNNFFYSLFCEKRVFWLITLLVRIDENNNLAILVTSQPQSYNFCSRRLQIFFFFFDGVLQNKDPLCHHHVFLRKIFIDKKYFYRLTFSHSSKYLPYPCSYQIHIQLFSVFWISLFSFSFTRCARSIIVFSAIPISYLMSNWTSYLHLSQVLFSL